MRGNDWPEKDVLLLREQWGKVSCQEIGQRCNPKRTLSAITGKAHRMGLPVLESASTKSMIEAKRKAIKAQASRPPPPPPPPEPTEEDNEWKILTHWEPGDPSTWTVRTHEDPIYLRHCAAVMLSSFGVVGEAAAGAGGPGDSRVVPEPASGE